MRNLVAATLILFFALSSTLSSSSTDIKNSVTCKNVSEGKCNSYKCALKLSLLFYEAQRSGELPADNRISWRSSSTRKDGIWSNEKSIDLTGGYFDAGDHAKFNFPQAAAMNMLGLGLIKYKKGYEIAGEWENGLKAFKWGIDYLKKCHSKPTELWAQVGDGKIDHSRWERPEIQYPDTDVGNNKENYSKNRPIQKIDESHPGSDFAGEVSTAFAMASIIFKNEDKTYSEDSLKRAKQLYEFADKYRGGYSSSIKGDNYKTRDDYVDELALASIWLYIATGESPYLTAAENHWKVMKKKFVAKISWANKSRLVALMLAEITGKTEYKSNMNDFFDRIQLKKTTEYGTKFISSWGSNRRIANVVFALMVASKMNINGKEKEIIEFSQSQINSILGYNKKQQSFLIGYGSNYPKNPHHRSSSCPTTSCGWSFFSSNNNNTFELTGGLVGGPKCLVGCYDDNRKDYVANEVAIDYNAAFQSALAALVEETC